jgi:hypothetical protein
MRTTKTVAWLAAFLTLAATATWVRAAPTPREILGGELIVREALDKLDAPPGRVRYVSGDDLARAFPDYLFYVAQYPAASVADLPKPLKLANVFAVDPDGRATLLAGRTELVELFKTAYYPPRGTVRCKFAVRAALLLLEAEHPGYVFTLPEDEIKLTNDADGGKQAVGRLVLKDGGPGSIEVTLTLNPCCEVLGVTEVVRLKEVDPGVAAVTTTEVTVAEKRVRVFLEREKRSVEGIKIIEDPVVTEVLPGYRFFVAAPADPDKVDPKVGEVRNILVVGPDGDPQELFGGTLGTTRLLASLFGPVTGDPGIQKALRVTTRLLEAARPGFKFGPPAAPQITTEEGGLRQVTTTIPETGPRGRKGILRIRLTFGRRGRLVAFTYGFHPVRD